MQTFLRIFTRFPWTISVVFLLFSCLFFAPLARGGTVNVTVDVGSNGGVTGQVQGTFATCCNSSGQNCVNHGTVYLYLNQTSFYECGTSGDGSAACSYTRDRWGLHGTHTYRGKLSDCQGSMEDTYTLTLDNTPSVAVTSPSGTVSGPFDITGAATFKPTLSATKGTINLHINGYYASAATKYCTAETCSFSYEELKGKKYEMNHGNNYSV